MSDLFAKRVPFKVLALLVPVFIMLIFTNVVADEDIKIITLITDNGVEFQAFVAGPEDARAGVLLAHDWFGVSDFYKEAMVKLGNQGYRVIAVDYYDGGAATTHGEAFKLMQKVDAGLVAEKLRAGLSALKTEGRSIATFGFSLGTEYAYRAALNDGDVDAVVIWYGFMPSTDEDVVPLKADMLAVLGSLDGPAADQGAAYSKLMDAHDKSAELYIYPQAHHAFAQPLFNAGATYDMAGAAAAWAVTLDFLSRKLQ